jgi:hypothetical protein
MASMAVSVLLLNKTKGSDFRDFLGEGANIVGIEYEIGA